MDIDDADDHASEAQDKPKEGGIPRYMRLRAFEALGIFMNNLSRDDILPYYEEIGTVLNTILETQLDLGTKFLSIN